MEDRREGRSIINPDLEVTQDLWVVSAINSGPALAGHSVIVLEGIRPPQGGNLYAQPFTIKTDIRAGVAGDQNSSTSTDHTPSSSSAGSSSNSSLSGTTGSSLTPPCNNPRGIITRIDIKNSDERDWRPLDYRNNTKRSWLVRHEDAEIMMRQIVADRQRVRLSMVGDAEPIPYQFLGAGHPFARADGGHNCASWVQEKLAVAGVDAAGKPKPEKVAGGGCVIL